jgi:hypothetical protein
VADDLTDAIRENAAGPSRASGDQVSFQQHPPRDQIEADRYLRSATAVANNRRGLRLQKILPPGAV